MLKLAKSEELFQMLRERVETMYHGDRFPSVRQLMKEYNVSQFTVAPAMTQLESEGYIKCIVGKGTFVNHATRVRPKKILLLAPQWPSVAIHDMIQKLQQEVGNRSYLPETILYNVEEDIYGKLADYDADALIIDPVNPGDVDPEHIKAIINSPVPIVLIRANIPNSRVNFTCGNNPVAGMLAANYLHSKGHRKIALVISEPKYQTCRDLADGFRHGVQLNGGEVTVIDCETNPGEDATARTYHYMRQWLAANTIDFTAMFVVSDETTFAALNALNEAGITVPDQLSVMGFGNVSSGIFYNPPLTTIDTDRVQMAIAALDIIEKCFADPEQAGLQTNVYPQVVERKSVRDMNN